MENIIQKYLNFFKFIETNSKIQIEKQYFEDEVLDITDEDIKDSIDMFINEIKNPIGPQYYDLFRISELSICWTSSDHGFIYGGVQNTALLETLYQNSEFWSVYNSLNEYKPDAKELEFLKKLNWFEKQAWGDDGKFGTFLREPGEFPPPIFFYDSGAYFPMPLTLEEYFDAMFASCAVRGWQYFYIDFPEDFPNLKEVNKIKVINEMETAVKILPQLFEDMDFTYHEAKLKNII